LSWNDTQETKGFLTQCEELVDFVARDRDDIACIQLVFIVTQAQTGMPVQNIDSMLMRMLIE